MVIDSSAILAILLDEPERAQFARLIEDDALRIISAVGRVEGGMVIEARKGEQGRVLLDRSLRLIGAQILSVTTEQAETALQAFRQYGRGRHAASLNIGDCFAYAAAMATGEKLLFKGGDFAQTDIPPATHA
jgi:ribonuclease VapC